MLLCVNVGGKSTRIINNYEYDGRIVFEYSEYYQMKTNKNIQLPDNSSKEPDE